MPPVESTEKTKQPRMGETEREMVHATSIELSQDAQACTVHGTFRYVLRLDKVR